ncbi:unnamed protein product, partial [Pleuronectes platessa]
ARMANAIRMTASLPNPIGRQPHSMVGIDSTDTPKKWVMRMQQPSASLQDPIRIDFMAAIIPLKLEGDLATSNISWRNRRISRGPGPTFEPEEKRKEKVQWAGYKRSQQTGSLHGHLDGEMLTQIIMWHLTIQREAKALPVATTCSFNSFARKEDTYCTSAASHIPATKKRRLAWSNTPLPPTRSVSKWLRKQMGRANVASFQQPVF